MNFKGLASGAGAIVLSLAASWSGNVLATTAEHEVGRFCKNCTYQQAVELAKQGAVPNITCRISSTPTDDYVESCFSQAKLYYVLDETSRQLYGFIVKHGNQGVPRHALRLVVENRNLSRDHTTLIFEALDAKQLLARNLAKATSDFVRTIDTEVLAGPASSGLKLFSTDNSSVAATDVKANCQNDPHSRAFRDALDPSHVSRLNLQLNNMVQEGIASGHYESQADALGKFTFGLTGTNLTGGIAGRVPKVLLSATWGTKEVESRYVDHKYRSSRDSSMSQLRWVTSLRGADINLALSQGSSYIDGMRLDLLIGMDGYHDPKISFCLAKAVLEMSKNSTFEQTTNQGDIEHWEGGSPIIGNDWGSSHANDNGWICEYSMFNRTGAKIAGFLGRCP